MLPFRGSFMVPPIDLDESAYGLTMFEPSNNSQPELMQ